jgi:Secretion system C-terminal sorting domain
MKKYFLILTVILFTSLVNFAQLVTISTSPLAATNITQGSVNNVVYIAKMDVTTLPVIVNSIQFTLTGTHDANDLTTIGFYFNASAPSLTGASLLNSVAATFAAPHTYNVPNNFVAPINISAGATGYFIVAVNVNAAGTSGNTIKIDGAANPVTFGYTTSPTITNNQTDVAGTQTILAALVTLSTSAIAASNIAQGSTNNIVYIAKMDVTALPVIVNSIQFTLTGTHDANDLTIIGFYYNASAPSLTGASLLNTASATFAAPQVYNIPNNFVAPINIAAGATGYFIVAVNVNAAGTGGNTVKIDGAANPVTFAYSTSPTITNNQTNVAGAQTILAAGVTLSTTTIAASSIVQGSINNIVYAVKMDVTALPVIVNSIQFTLTGTHDANDLTIIGFYYNASAPSLTGASLLNNVAATFAAPHTYNIPNNFVAPINIAAGATGYFIIAVNVNAAGTSGNTVKINGLTDPVSFGYNTSPTITNNQADVAGTQTILAAGVTLTTSPIAVSNISQGSTNNIVYAVKMDVTSLPVTVNSIQFTLTGTHDANDLTIVSFYYNPLAPSLTGASLLNNVAATFAAPHTYNIPNNFVAPINIAAGATGYFMVCVNVNAIGTAGNTVKLNGLTNPVTFGYTTSPPITNNQTDVAGIKTISSILPLTLLSFAGNITEKQEVKIEWETAQEINTKDFEIEWSDDGVYFTKIAVLPSAGNSTQQLSYNYLHKNPTDGPNYYRLKMQDIDGRFTYSSIIKIIVTVNTFSVTAFPNPVINYVQLDMKAPKSETILLTMHSANGKIIASKQFAVTKGSNLLKWDVQSLSTGSYFISSSNIPLPTIKIIKK